MPDQPSASPLVTLGVPVYNGGRFITEALQSLLDQTHPSLEILISDNGSTDDTESICRRFAAADPRIRYVRHGVNRGAIFNFEFLVQEAKGKYFAWCAHDDVRYPRFAAACVEALEAHPSAVLCNGIVEFLDEKGRVRSNWKDLNFETLGMTKAQRMLRLVDHMDWVDMMGLMRLDALRKALPFEPLWGGDVILSMKLLAMGDFLKVNEVLFQYRVRSKPKGAKQTMEEVTGQATRVDHPYLDMVESMLRAALGSFPTEAEREAFFWSYVRTLVTVERHKPHPSWVEALAPEGGPGSRIEHVPSLLLHHLWPSLSSDSVLDDRLKARTQLILLGCPKNPLEGSSPAILGPALRQAYPGARILLVGRPGPLRAQASCGEDERIALPPYWRKAKLLRVLSDLMRRNVDLAIHPGTTGEEHELDLCLTGVRAYRTHGLQSPPVPLRWTVKTLWRKFKDRNGAFIHLVEEGPMPLRQKAFFEAIGLD